MKLPRNVSGDKLAGLLAEYDYTVIRQTGSHIRLVSNFKGTKHTITIPKHSPLKIGTLGGIVKDIADYLEVEKSELISRLFG